MNKRITTLLPPYNSVSTTQGAWWSKYGKTTVQWLPIELRIKCKLLPMAFKDHYVWPMPLTPTSSCPRVPDACPWLALCSLNQQAHSHLKASALTACSRCLEFSCPYPHLAGSWLFLESSILWLLLIILLLLYYSIMHHLFRTAFSNQRSSPYLHPPFFITLPCCTVFTAPVTIWYYLPAF